MAKMQYQQRKIYAVYEKNADRTCRTCFAIFHQDNMTLKNGEDLALEDQPIDNKIKALVETNSHMTTRAMAETLKISQSRAYS